jgi:stage II sporulation protein D
MNQRWWAMLTALLFFPFCPILAQDVRIGVLGIFHPQEITLSSTGGEPIVVTAEGKTIFLSAAQNSEVAHLKVSGDHLVLQIGCKAILTKGLHAASSNDGAAGFTIAIPGKIKRQYRGTLDVSAVNGALVPVVTMEMETAVASVVQAESEPDTPIEALKAQAVVTRSYFVAGRGRHTNFDFCDLTHCQFLREPPKPDNAASMAALATHGLILTFEDKPLAAMFTRSCGGETQTLSAIGIPAKDYLYFSVRCEACYGNPVRWTRRVSTHDASILFAQGEKGRLAVDRRLGWSAVPSNRFTARNVDGAVLLHGTGEGHGLGFCQRGARAMAAEGEDFRKIILHYFPNTTIRKVAERPML